MWHARLAALPVVPIPVRERILRAAGHRFAPGSRIFPGSLVLGTKLSLGHGTFVNIDCLIDARGDVTLGDDVHVATGVQILTTSHEPGPPNRRAGRLSVSPVTVGNGAWLGAGTIVLPGVTIGEGCVVAAGAVVAEDLPPDGLYGGVPARLIRVLDDRTR